jgi:hypothetical protein
MTQIRIHAPQAQKWEQKSEMDKKNKGEGK